MNYKKLLTVIALTAITQAAHAQSLTPGASVNHMLNCSLPVSPSGNMIAGTRYYLNCTTKALRPEYNLVGCKLGTKVQYPGAKIEYSSLDMIIQDETRAELENDPKSIKVVIKKTNTMSAMVKIGSSSRAVCKEISL